MASHERTPQSVLDAPKSVPIVVYSHYGLSRAERRGQVPVSMKRRIATFGLRNTPFRGKVWDWERSK